MRRNITRDLLVRVFTPLELPGITRRLLRYAIEDYGDDLGFTGGRIWERQGDVYRMTDQVGGNGDRLGYTFPADHPYIEQMKRDGLIMYKRGDEGWDSTLEDPMGVDGFTAVPIGRDEKYIAAFDTIGKKRRIQKRILSDISIISQTALAEAERISQEALVEAKKKGQLEHERGHLHSEVNIAYETQKSILPRSLPKFPGFGMYVVFKPLK
ncbi:MAG: hypothetical protein KKC05_00675, partial [Nanoarchaeota archaeon]|nr:hypothetical protein [Nanoarchaeota archaeon]